MNVCFDDDDRNSLCFNYLAILYCDCNQVVNNERFFLAANMTRGHNTVCFARQELVF